MKGTGVKGMEKDPWVLLIELWVNFIVEKICMQKINGFIKSGVGAFPFENVGTTL